MQSEVTTSENQESTVNKGTTTESTDASPSPTIAPAANEIVAVPTQTATTKTESTEEV